MEIIRETQNRLLEAAMKELEAEKNGARREGITKNWVICPEFTRATIDIYSRPVVLLKSDIFKNKDLRATTGMFALKYLSPFGIRTPSKRGDPGRPFRIVQDLAKKSTSLSGPAEFHKLCQEMPEFQWILENTNYTDKLFEYAKKCSGFRFEFTVNWEAYDKRIKDKYGEDKDAFVSYYCDNEEYNKYMKDTNDFGKIKINSVVLDEAAKEEYNTNIKEYKERLKELNPNE